MSVISVAPISTHAHITAAVSYTHLDVYKRQLILIVRLRSFYRLPLMNPAECTLFDFLTFDFFPMNGGSWPIALTTNLEDQANFNRGLFVLAFDKLISDYKAAATIL